MSVRGIRIPNPYKFKSGVVARFEVVRETAKAVLIRLVLHSPQLGDYAKAENWFPKKVVEIGDSYIIFPNKMLFYKNLDFARAVCQIKDEIASQGVDNRCSP